MSAPRLARRLRARAAAVGAVLAVLVLGITLPGGALAGSSFESADGNLTPSDANHKDWSNAPGFAKGIDKASGSTDDSFAMGPKQDDEGPAIGFGSIPPNKDDLTRFYLGKETVSNIDFLYLAWERTPSTGASAHEGFELNQRQCTAGDSTDTDCSTNGVTPKRTDGDLLLVYDFEGGTGTPSISALIWLTPGGTSGTCDAAKAPPCWGNRKNLTDFGEADAAVNSSATTDPIPPDASPDAPRNLDPFTFGEAGVNLTGSGIFGSGCRSFGSAYLVSRSSGNSFRATLKDFIAPIAVEIDNCAPPTFTTAQTITPNDSATISGGYSPTGTITFSLFDNDQCSGNPAFTQTVTVSGNGSYHTSNPTSSGAMVSVGTGTWYWLVTYSGDSNNTGFTLACGTEQFTVANS